ncbi:hypothetical protein ACFQ71_23715, partial [Streptomyces sp. NPDC056534]|uniref:hypothetical protein n=1 Tax=Streptomyces sp. NPDC056534 TaxID=3345857 RepID=UPI00367EA493
TGPNHTSNLTVTTIPRPEKLPIRRHFRRKRPLKRRFLDVIVVDPYMTDRVKQFDAGRVVGADPSSDAAAGGDTSAGLGSASDR